MGSSGYGSIFGAGFTVCGGAPPTPEGYCSSVGEIVMVDESNIIPKSTSFLQGWIYNQPTYPSGSDKTTFLAENYTNWLTREIEVYQIFK